MIQANRTRQINAAIFPTDTLFVSAASASGAPVSMTLSGASDISEILRHVSKNMETDSPMVVRIQLRNGTQGWTSRHTIVVGGNARKGGGRMSN